ncbi:MAG: LysE family transporter [Opitutales bacterium]|nr:LysE family transporter [Opitutales bacterium]
MDTAAFLLSIAILHLAASLSPGPDSLLTVRNSLRGGTTDGFATLGGILLGVALQITLAMAGLTLLLDHLPAAQTVLAVAGAGFLAYLGMRSLRAGAAPAAEDSPAARRHPRTALAEGFATNLLNPKAIAYFISVFSLTLTPALPLRLRFTAALLMIAVQAAGFAALILLARTLRQRITPLMRPLDALSGIFFLLFAAAWLLHALRTA